MSTPITELRHQISLESAIRMTTLYRTRRELLQAELEGKLVLPISETFNRKAFDDLLAQPGCMGVRMYLALDDAYQLRTLFVAVREDETEILPASITEASGEIIEVGKICPPDCTTSSPLSS